MELLIIVIIIAAAVVAEQMVYSRFGGKNVSYSCRFEDEVINEGDETTLSERVENKKLLPVPWLKSELTIPVHTEPVGGDSTVAGGDRFITGFFMVKSYSGVKRVRKIKALKRGVYRVTAARVQTADLLGGIRISLSAESIGESLTVLPVPAKCGSVLPVRLKRQTGEQLVRQSLVTDPFFTAGVRDYRFGDPLKSIHWKASAHMGALMVRQEERTARRCLMILLNVQTDSERVGTAVSDEALLEHTIRLCVSAIEEAAAEGFSFVLASNGFTRENAPLTLSEAYGDGGIERALYALAELSGEMYMPMRQFLKGYGRVSPDMSAVLITPYADDCVSQWKGLNPDGAVIVSGYGKDYEGIADSVIPLPERSDC